MRRRRPIGGRTRRCSRTPHRFSTRAHDAFRLSWMLERQGRGARPSSSRIAGAAGKRLDRTKLTEARASAGEGRRRRRRLPRRAQRLQSRLLATARSPAGRFADARREGRTRARPAPRGSPGCIARSRLGGRSARRWRRTPHAIPRRRWMASAACSARSRTRGTRACGRRLDEVAASPRRRPRAAPRRDSTPRHRPRNAYPARMPVTDRAARARRGGLRRTPGCAREPEHGQRRARRLGSDGRPGRDRGRALVDFLAANVFSGSGAHSFYKRIWGAALAYSGYIAVNPRPARMHVYSDRCADLPQLTALRRRRGAQGARRSPLRRLRRGEHLLRAHRGHLRAASGGHGDRPRRRRDAGARPCLPHAAPVAPVTPRACRGHPRPPGSRLRVGHPDPRRGHGGASRRSPVVRHRSRGAARAATRPPCVRRAGPNCRCSASTRGTSGSRTDGHLQRLRLGRTVLAAEGRFRRIFGSEEIS